MGVSTSKDQSNDIKSMFSFKKQINDPSKQNKMNLNCLGYGDTKLLSAVNDSQEVVLKEINAIDESDFKAWKERINGRKNDCENIIQIKNCDFLEEKQLCSKFYKIHILFEYIPKTLQHLITEKEEQRIRFSENGIWQMLCGAIKGLSHLQSQSIKHGNLRTTTLSIIEADELTLKIFDCALLMKMNSFIAVIQDPNNLQKGFYLSPIQAKSIFEHNSSPDHNHYKSDVFALGMIMLQTCLLKPCWVCYSFETGGIDINQKELLLEEVNLNYPNQIATILRSMLEIEECDRPDFIQLQQYLHEKYLPLNNFFENKPNLPFDQQEFYPSNENLYNYDQILRGNGQIEDFQGVPPEHSEKFNYSKEQIEDYEFEEYPQNQINQQQQFQEQEYKVRLFQDQQDFQNTQKQQLVGTSAVQMVNKIQDDKPDGVIPLINFNPSKSSKYDVNYKPQNGSPHQPYASLKMDEDQYINDYNKIDDQKQGFKDSKDSFKAPENVQEKVAYIHSTNQPSTNNEQQLNRGNFEKNNHSTSNDYSSRPKFEKNNHSTSNDDYSSERNNQFVNNSFKKEVTIQPITLAYTNPIQFEDKSDDWKTNLNLQKNDYDVNFRWRQENDYKDQKQNQTTSNLRSAAIEDFPKDSLPKVNYDLQFPIVRQQQTDFNANKFEDISITKKSDFQPFNLQDSNRNKQFEGLKYQQDRQSTNNYFGNQNSTYQNGIGVKQGNYEYKSYNTNPSSIQQGQSQASQAKLSNLESYKFQDSYGKFENLAPLTTIDLNKESWPQYVNETYSDGSRYNGEKVNSLRGGFGKLYFQDGARFEGQWCKDKMHGYGTLYYSSGKAAYEGQWVQDKFEGHGALYNESPTPLLKDFDGRDFDLIDNSWVRYVGNFSDDNKHGFGTLYLKDGSKFEGTFQNDQIEGEGRFTQRFGQVLQGRWRCNKLVQ